MFRVGRSTCQAHRVAWELTYGSPPSGMLRTACGNPRCVRPDHQVLVARKLGPANLARTPEVRFWEKVEKGPGCWLWTASTVRTGFGQFGVNLPGGGRRLVPVHRYAWELAHGAIPDGAEVVHTCGTLRCVRPDHLRLRIGGPAPTEPTPREIAVLRARLRHGMGYGSMKRAAAELGIGRENAANHLQKLRERIGVATNAEAVRWLDEHQPGWRTATPAPIERPVQDGP